MWSDTPFEGNEVAAETTGPARFRLGDDRRSRLAERRSLRRDLGAALAQQSFLLRYQPRICLRDARPVAAEAVLQWPHRKRGLLSAGMFLPLAEETGQAVAIGGWALRTACAAASGWPDLSVSVTISVRQMQERVILSQVAEALACSGLPPERLDLLLAEDMLAAFDLETTLLLSALRDLGVGVVLADFGGGYASLTMLKRLPLTALRIDRSLVRMLPDSVEDAPIVCAVVGLAHALGLVVMADGVENEEQHRFLIAAGCHQGQGSLLAAPMDADELGRLAAAPPARQATRSTRSIAARSVGPSGSSSEP